jgi:hypothetical protein
VDSVRLESFLDELQKIAAAHGLSKVLKARLGRRPISAAKLIEKHNNGTWLKKHGDSQGNPQDVRGSGSDDPGAARLPRRPGQVPTTDPANIPMQAKVGAAEPEKKKEKPSFSERNPNLSQWGKATGAGMGASGAQLGSSLAFMSQATKERPGDAAMEEYLTRTAPVPVLRPEGPVLGGAHFSPGASSLGGAAAGGPAGPHVKVPRDWKNPATLAHELGHAEIHKSRLGHLIQNPVTMAAASAGAPLASSVGGFASGFSDDPRIRRAGILAPLVMQAPQLLYEAGASVKGLQKMRRGGASAGQLLNAGKMLLPAYGTYAAGAAKNVAGAAAGQAVGGGIHGALKRRAERKAGLKKKEGMYRLTDGTLPMTSGEDMTAGNSKPRKAGEIPTQNNMNAAEPDGRIEPPAGRMHPVITNDESAKRPKKGNTPTSGRDNVVDRYDQRDNATTVTGIAQHSTNIGAFNSPAEHT